MASSPTPPGKYKENIPSNEKTIKMSKEIKASIIYHPEDQTTGKSRKFRQADCIQLLLDSGTAKSSEEAKTQLDALVNANVLTPSKGRRGSVLVGNSPLKNRKFRFDDAALGKLEGTSPSKFQLRVNELESAEADHANNNNNNANNTSKSFLWVLSSVIVAAFLKFYPHLGDLKASLMTKIINLGVIVLTLFLGYIMLVKISPSKTQISPNYNSQQSNQDAGDSAKIPTIHHKDIISTLESVSTEHVLNFTWIQAGRLLRGCENALKLSTTPPEIKSSAASMLSLPVMAEIRSKYKQGFSVMTAMNTDSGWKFYKESKDGSSKVSTMYINGSLWIKVDGQVKCRSESCAAIWKEGNLYHHWFPQTRHSRILHSYSPTDIVLHFGGSNPISDTEVIVHAWGINHFEEGFFLIVGKSVDEYKVGDEQVKVFKKKFMTTRNHVNALQIMVEPVDESNTRVCMVQSIRMPIPLPRRFLEWVLGNVFLHLLGAMSHKAQKAEAPDSTLPHTERVKSTKFYSETFVPAVRKLFKQRGVCENYESVYFPSKLGK
ncbi:hypothetical protein ScalyP_jg6176 [Parmales sp. scaly parma]|nr:hypothetical protein ScalyP_jg6176 [Parmales sp. scaly parma]